MHRPTSEQSFVAVLLPDRMGRNERLERIDAAIDWRQLAKVVDGVYAAPTGRPSYPLWIIRVIRPVLFTDIRPP